MPTIYMETTKIPVEKTAHEICSYLAAADARQIVTEYENRELTGLRWTLEVEGQTIPFMMPARVDPLYDILLRRLAPRNREKKSEEVREQAKRVAWRQLLRWVQAQLALIETGMVSSGEVFSPYIEVAPGRSLFQQLSETKFKMLPAPRG